MKKIILLFNLALVFVASCSDSRHKIEGQLIGKWKEDKKSNAVFLLYKKPEGTILRTIYKSQEKYDENPVTIQNNTINYVEQGNYQGEYFKIEPDQTLGFYTRNNELFAKGYPIK